MILRSSTILASCDLEEENLTEKRAIIAVESKKSLFPEHRFRLLERRRRVR